MKCCKATSVGFVAIILVVTMAQLTDNFLQLGDKSCCIKTTFLVQLNNMFVKHKCFGKKLYHFDG